MPPTLGQRLRHAREKLGLSLQDVAHTTRIPAARLLDLEEDNFTSFGSITYAKGHLRAYAGLLNVDAEEVLCQMKVPPLGGNRDYRYLVETYGPLKPLPEKPAPLLRRSNVPSGRSSLILASVSAFFAMVIGGVLLGSAFFGGAKDTQAAGNGTSQKADVAVTDPPKAERVDDEAGEEFDVYDISVVTERNNAILPGRSGAPVPPKAVPVSDKEAARELLRTPKALPVP